MNSLNKKKTKDIKTKQQNGDKTYHIEQKKTKIKIRRLIEKNIDINIK